MEATIFYCTSHMNSNGSFSDFEKNVFRVQYKRFLSFKQHVKTAGSPPIFRRPMIADSHPIIGPRSDPSQAANYVCKLSSLPQISPNALATVFDSKTTHPTFFRGIASIVSSARSLARLMRRLGYARLAIIATTTTLDQTTVQAFTTEASAIKLQIVTSQIIATGVCDDMTYQARRGG